MGLPFNRNENADLLRQTLGSTGIAIFGAMKANPLPKILITYGASWTMIPATVSNE